MTYYKFLSKNLTHNSFTYKIGINEDVHPLNEDITKDCVKGGLYFTDRKNITEFYTFGPYLGIIEIPEGEKVIKVGNKYRAHRIILKEIITDEREIMKYLDVKNPLASLWASQFGYLNVLEYLYDRGCPLNSYASTLAAQNGHFEVLKYLHNKGCSLNPYAITKAVGGGYLDIVKYLRDNGCKWDSSTMLCAAKNGHLNVVKYLHQNGCEWNSLASIYASYNGHFEVAKYLEENGCV